MFASRKSLLNKTGPDAASSLKADEEPPRWAALPNGVLNDIFQHASPPCLANLARVATPWRHAADDAALWRRHAAALGRRTLGSVPELKSVCRHAWLTEANLLAGRARAEHAVHHGRSVFEVSLNPDGSKLATVADDGTARVTSMTSGTELLSFTHTERDPKLCWSPDGSKLALFGDTLRIMDAIGGTELASFRLTGSVRNVLWTPDSSKVASLTSDGKARMLDATGGDAVRIESNAVAADICLSRDGSKLTLALYGGTACVANTASGAEMWRISYPRSTRPYLSSDGSKVTFASSGGAVYIVDAISKAELTHIHHTGSDAVVVSWSPDDSKVALAWANGTARIADATNNAAEGTCLSYTSQVNSFCWSPDSSKLAAELNDRTVRIMDVPSGAELALIRCAFFCWRPPVYWSPDSNKVVVLTPPDHTARIMDAARGVELFRVEHAREVRTFCWSSDGSKVATGSSDDTARIIDFGPAPTAY